MIYTDLFNHALSIQPADGVHIVSLSQAEHAELIASFQAMCDETTSSPAAIAKELLALRTEITLFGLTIRFNLTP